MTDLPGDRQQTASPPVPDAVRTQILATEHWGLLATRSMTWSEMFTRAGMFVTILSASLVSMAFVAQATGFDQSFRVFAILVLLVTLVMGIGTMIRLADALEEDIWLVLAMNRLRHAYLDIAPDLAPFFTTGHHDDISGILVSIGPERRIGGAGRILSAIASMIGILNCLLVGAIVTLAVYLLTEQAAVSTLAGITVGLAVFAWVMVVLPMKQIRQGLAKLEIRFPSPAESAPGSQARAQD
jgi:hypothetical protein